MKVALPLLATLALVAASPARLVEKRDEISARFAEDDGNTQVPLAVNGKCDEGWTVFQSDGKDLCCPPGKECDDGGVRNAPNDDVDVQENIWRCLWVLRYCTPTYCVYRRVRCWWV